MLFLWTLVKSQNLPVGAPVELNPAWGLPCQHQSGDRRGRASSLCFLTRCELRHEAGTTAGNCYIDCSSQVQRTALRPFRKQITLLSVCLHSWTACRRSKGSSHHCCDENFLKHKKSTWEFHSSARSRVNKGRSLSKFNWKHFSPIQYFSGGGRAFFPYALRLFGWGDLWLAVFLSLEVKVGKLMKTDTNLEVVPTLIWLEWRPPASFVTPCGVHFGLFTILHFLQGGIWNC